jgi:hypothetical protein
MAVPIFPMAVPIFQPGSCYPRLISLHNSPARSFANAVVCNMRYRVSIRSLSTQSVNAWPLLCIVITITRKASVFWCFSQIDG